MSPLAVCFKDRYTLIEQSVSINYYETIELGHYQLASIVLIASIFPTRPGTIVSKSEARRWLDDAAFQNILASERIFLARNCRI